MRYLTDCLHFTESRTWCDECKRIPAAATALQKLVTRCADCRLNRSHGTSEQEAFRARRRHVMKHPGHSPSSEWVDLDQPATRRRR